MEKLDRVLMSGEWENLFPCVHGYKLPMEMSYHNLIVLSTIHSHDKKPREFGFELSWLKNLDLLGKVQEICTDPTRDSVPLDRVHFKLKNVRQILKGWGYNHAGQVEKRKKGDIWRLDAVGNHGGNKHPD
jgi:hypothetical protein